MVPPLFYVTSACSKSCLLTSTGCHTADLLGAQTFLSLLPRDARRLDVGKKSLASCCGRSGFCVSLQLSFPFIDPTFTSKANGSSIVKGRLNSERQFFFNSLGDCVSAPAHRCNLDKITHEHLRLVGHAQRNACKKVAKCVWLVESEISKLKFDEWKCVRRQKCWFLIHAQSTPIRKNVFDLNSHHGVFQFLEITFQLSLKKMKELFALKTWSFHPSV